MTTTKTTLEFDNQDDVLMLELGVVAEMIGQGAEEEAESVGSASPSSRARQHKFVDYSRALDATQLYLNEIGFSPLLSPEEEVHFARMARRGEAAGRKRMIESNLRLVV